MKFRYDSYGKFTTQDEKLSDADKAILRVHLAIEEAAELIETALEALEVGKTNKARLLVADYLKTVYPANVLEHLKSEGRW